MVPNMAGGHTNMKNASSLTREDCNKPDSTIDPDSIKMLPAIVFIVSFSLQFNLVNILFYGFHKAGNLETP